MGPILNLELGKRKLPWFGDWGGEGCLRRCEHLVEALVHVQRVPLACNLRHGCIQILPVNHLVSQFADNPTLPVMGEPNDFSGSRI